MEERILCGVTLSERPLLPRVEGALWLQENHNVTAYRVGDCLGPKGSFDSSLQRKSCQARVSGKYRGPSTPRCARRSEEHTSELQSLRHLVCRLLLEKKKQ